jgi:hypothetical protein
VRRWLLALAIVASACALPVAIPARSTEAPLTAGAVTKVGGMSAPKATHTATRLLDGRVLITGGYDGSCRIRETELFIPSTRTFVAGAPLGVARCDHTATLLEDGRVLVAGGLNVKDALRGAELFDPARGTFVSTGDMGEARDGPTATRLRDGTVLVTGGIDGARYLASAERYDPRTGAFRRVADMHAARMAHTATLLADGRVLIVGGSSARGRVEATAELFDPATGTFSDTGPMTTERYKHAAIALRDGRVLVVGGSDARDFAGRYASAEIFDPRDGAFHAGGAMASPRYKVPAALALLASGEVLVAGGAAVAEVFDGRSFRTVAGTLDASWSFATATTLDDGDVLIAGGYDDRIRPTAGAWVFRP